MDDPVASAPTDDGDARERPADASPGSAPVVLFDGSCNLCNGTVQFVLDRERAPELRFAPLQSEIARALLVEAFGEREAERLARGATGNGDPDSIVVLEGGRGFTRSTAALRMLRHLRAPYGWIYALVVVPRPLRDLVYRWIARHRYRWFGKSETCRVPTPELRRRFLA